MQASEEVFYRKLKKENTKLHKALEKAKKQLCQVCNHISIPKNCGRYPCWRITIINQVLKGD